MYSFIWWMVNNTEMDCGDYMQMGLFASENV